MSFELISKLAEPKFDLKRARLDAFKIIDDLKLPQIGLTHSKKELSAHEKILESTGSILNRETNTFKFKETDFTEFNEAYKNTYLYEIYKQLPNIGRFRIMTMFGPSCYTIHNDMTRRYHFVLETNIDCLFLFPRKKLQFHIPADGNLYLLDTRFKHTFLNGSRDRRVHLVLDDLSTI